MVGAWPTYIEEGFRTRPGDQVQASVDGVLQPFLTPLELSGPPPGGDNASGGGGGSSSSSGSGGSNVDALLRWKDNPGLCSGVVFRGRLGGNRAVRANVPFPFLGTMETHRNGTRFKPSERDLTRGCVVLTAQTVYEPTVRMHYPDEFLARVKVDAPFSLLWPGHAAAKGKHASTAPAGGCGGSSGGGDVGYGAGATGAESSGVNTHKEIGLELERMHKEIRLELERLPSSGPAPFFHAGYTAYFEITLEKTVPPLEWRGFHLECVAIGLANEFFPLTWVLGFLFVRWA